MANEEEEIELTVAWKGLTAYFKHLSVAEKRAMFLRATPIIIGIYKEFGYRFDGLEDAQIMEVKINE